jgi:hypothetical protein
MLLPEILEAPRCSGSLYSATTLYGVTNTQQMNYEGPHVYVQQCQVIYFSDTIGHSHTPIQTQSDTATHHTATHHTATHHTAIHHTATHHTATHQTVTHQFRHNRTQPHTTQPHTTQPHIFFYVQGSLHHEYMSITVQQDATIYSLFISVNCFTCFGWYLYPSSGAHITASTASVISVTCC